MVGQSSSTEPMDITLETCTALKACHCNEETPWPPNFTKIHHLRIIFQLPRKRDASIVRPDNLSDSNALPACTPWKSHPGQTPEFAGTPEPFPTSVGPDQGPVIAERTPFWTDGPTPVSLVFGGFTKYVLNPSFFRKISKRFTASIFQQGPQVFSNTQTLDTPSFCWTLNQVVFFGPSSEKPHPDLCNINIGGPTSSSWASRVATWMPSWETPG